MEYDYQWVTLFLSQLWQNLSLFRRVFLDYALITWVKGRKDLFSGFLIGFGENLVWAFYTSTLELFSEPPRCRLPYVILHSTLLPVGLQIATFRDWQGLFHLRTLRYLNKTSHTDKNQSLKWYTALGMGVCYLIAVFASCFIGYLSPVCWAFYSVPAAVLGVGPYFFLARAGTCVPNRVPTRKY